MGYLKERCEHGSPPSREEVVFYVLTWGSVALVGLVLDHFFGWDLLLRLFQIAHKRY